MTIVKSWSGKFHHFCAVSIIVLGVSAGSAHAAVTERTWDIRFNPLGLLIGMYDVEANVKVVDNVSVGPMFTYWNFDSTSKVTTFKLYRYGARANWHLSGVFANGVYLSGYYLRENLSVSESAVEWNNTTSTYQSVRYTGTATANDFGTLIGYQWNWDAVNFNFGVGRKFSQTGSISVNSSAGNSKSVATSNSTNGSFTMDFSLGYAF